MSCDLPLKDSLGGGYLNKDLGPAQFHQALRIRVVSLVIESALWDWGAN